MGWTFEFSCSRYWHDDAGIALVSLDAVALTTPVVFWSGGTFFAKRGDWQNSGQPIWIP